METLNPRPTIYSSVIYVLLGGSGDLSSRHLLPSLYRLWKAGKRPPNFLIMGVGLILWSNEQYREKILEQMIERGFVKPDDWDDFAKHLKWQYLNLDENALPGYLELKQRLIDFDKEKGSAKWIFYCAIPSQVFVPVLKYLGLAGMLEDHNKQIVALEKPIAKDLESANELQETIAKTCQPQQVVCVEHFGLKPMAQAMPKFIQTHPVVDDKFKLEHIKAIEVVAAESIGVPEQRIGFYDRCPCVSDMSSHLLIPMLSQLVVSLENRHSS